MIHLATQFFSIYAIDIVEIWKDKFETLIIIKERQLVQVVNLNYFPINSLRFFFKNGRDALYLLAILVYINISSKSHTLVISHSAKCFYKVFNIYFQHVYISCKFKLLEGVFLFILLYSQHALPQTFLYKFKQLEKIYFY